MTNNVSGEGNVNMPQLGLPNESLLANFNVTTESAGQTIASIESKIVRIGDDGSQTHITLKFIYSGNNPEVLKKLNADKPVLDSAYVIGFTNLGSDNNTESASSTSAAASAASTGNVFLTPNMMVAVTVNLMLLADAMKDFKTVDLAIKMMAIAVVWELAQTQADLAMELAETKAEQHMALAISAGIQMIGQITIGAVGAVGASGAGGKGLQSSIVHGGLGTAASHAMSSAGQVADNVIQALSTLEQGRIERDQKLYEGLSQIAQQMIKEAFEDFQTLTQLVQQILDKLAGIQQQNSQANTQG